MVQHTDDSAPGPADLQPGDDLPLTELEMLLNRPPSQRKRLAAQIGFVLLAGVVVAAVFWGSSVPQKTGALAPSPTSPPPALLILSNVNYGTLTINGKKQPDKLPILAAVHSNTYYRVSLNAPPFTPITCGLNLTSLQFPGGPWRAGNCYAFAVSNVGPLTLNGMVGTPTFRLYIFLGLDDLPAARQSQITTLLSQALTTQQDLTIPAGSYFATSFQAPTITSQRARASLGASASLAPVIPQDEADAHCAAFICARPIEPETAAPTSGQQWSVQVGLALRWTFSSASGAVISDVPFQGDAGGSPIEPDIGFFLSLNAAGAWTISPNAPVRAVSAQLQDSFCATGENILIRHWK